MHLNSLFGRFKKADFWRQSPKRKKNEERRHWDLRVETGPLDRASRCKVLFDLKYLYTLRLRGSRNETIQLIYVCFHIHV